jgi:hypothetical protein
MGEIILRLVTSNAVTKESATAGSCAASSVPNSANQPWGHQARRGGRATRQDDSRKGGSGGGPTDDGGLRDRQQLGGHAGCPPSTSGLSGASERRTSAA